MSNFFFQKGNIDILKSTGVQMENTGCRNNLPEN